MRHADLILTMTQSHLQSIVERWPNAAGRTCLLMPDRSDVADPIGQTVGAYRHCAAQIAAGVKHHAEQICGTSLTSASHSTARLSANNYPRRRVSSRLTARKVLP